MKFFFPPLFSFNLLLLLVAMLLSEVRLNTKKKKTFFKDHSSASFTLLPTSPLAVKISLMFIFIRLSFFIAQNFPSSTFYSPPTHPLIGVVHKITIFSLCIKTSEHNTLHMEHVYNCWRWNEEKHLSGKMCTYMNFMYCINNFLFHSLSIYIKMCTQIYWRGTRKLRKSIYLQSIDHSQYNTNDAILFIDGKREERHKADWERSAKNVQRLFTIEKQIENLSIFSLSQEHSIQLSCDALIACDITQNWDGFFISIL
jgi:hypothetical protein